MDPYNSYDLPKEYKHDPRYLSLLDRCYDKLGKNTVENKTLPAPKISFIDAKRTMWINSKDMCRVLNRELDHILKYISAELGTSCSLNLKGAIIIKGKYYEKQIVNIIKNYIKEYVKCETCNILDTKLQKDTITRLTYIICDSCNSKRALINITKGFHATTKADRKKKKI